MMLGGILAKILECEAYIGYCLAPNPELSAKNAYIS
jgi:hypothetical protein